jgi:hypothetical protein
VLLREILDNTLRTAAQHRFEDAAMRLYRCMELQAQIWLTEQTQGAYRHGKLQEGSALPQALQEWTNSLGNRGTKLTLEQIFVALGHLGDPRVQRVVEDLRLERRSRFRNTTEKRNTSVLAHGTSSIGVKGFERMKEIASEFLDFDLTQEAHPLPKFDIRWLE